MVKVKEKQNLQKMKNPTRLFIKNLELKKKENTHINKQTKSCPLRKEL